MFSRWEIVHWPNGKKMQLCDSKEHAEKLAAVYGKGHIVHEILFYDDGILYDKPYKKKK